MFGFLIVPPMIAGRLVMGMRTVSIVAALVGAGVALIRFAAAYRLDWPTGPADVALAGVVLAVVTAGQAARALARRGATSARAPEGYSRGPRRWGRARRVR